MPTRDRLDTDTDGLFLLWAARRTGVLDALTRHAGTAAEVADATDVSERAARIAVRTLADLGFLERVDGGESARTDRSDGTERGDAEYEITNRALGFLAKRDVRSIGRLPHALDELESLTALPETMVRGTPPAPSDDHLRNRLGAHYATDESVVRACVTAAVHERPDAGLVFDVAGGAGVYAVEFARRGYETTLVDDPAAIDVVEPLLSKRNVSLAAGAPDDLPAGGGDASESGGTSPDLVFAGDLTHRLSPAENRAFLGAAHDALAPDGALVLTDAVRGRSEAATRVAVTALASGDGDAYDEATYRDWLADAGFRDVRVSDVPGTDRQAVAGHRGVD
ncbi:MAG: class I SAM-dependent methyltransferase [Haloferacaceae archaeon]